MDVSREINLKRAFLYLLIGSITVSALIGIWVILIGNFGWFEGRILATTLILVGTSILGLSCGAYLESPRSHGSPLRFIPLAGIGLSVVSALAGLWLIWFTSNFSSEPKWIYKFLFVSIAFGFSFAHLSLLSLARLSEKFRWSLILAFISILTLASLLSIIVVFEPPSDGTLVFRIIGALSIVDAATTVMIPIFHRLSRADFPENRASSIEKIDEEIESLKQRISELEREKWDALNYDGEPKS